MSGRIYHFPRPFRRRPAPPPQLWPFDSYQRSWFHSSGFAILWAASFAAAILYVSGLAGVARHDRPYTELLAAVWGFYFLHPPLLRTRLGPLLVRTGRLLLLAGIAGFFGGIYWLILRNG